VIPAGLFEVLVAMLDPLEAAEQFRATNAGSLAQALLEASKEDRGKVKREWEALERLGHPKIRVPREETPDEAADAAADDLVIEKSPDGS
jgi:hypothetical protein